MSKAVIFALLVATAVSVLAAPAKDDTALYGRENDTVAMPVGQIRLPRATCDLLSGLGVGDSACAAHCIAMRYRGGWCDKGVCHCRR